MGFSPVVLPDHWVFKVPGPGFGPGSPDNSNWPLGLLCSPNQSIAPLKFVRDFLDFGIIPSVFLFGSRDLVPPFVRIFWKYFMAVIYEVLMIWKGMEYFQYR